MKRGTYSVILLLFVLYLALLVAVIVFKVGTEPFSDHTDLIIGSPETAINLKPLYTLRRYWHIRHEINFRTMAVRNLAGNIIPFIPLGIFLPLLWRDRHAFIFTLIAALNIILLIELSQLVFRRGIFDIDDIILNAAGVIVGYLVYRLVRALRSGSRRKE